jgi:Spx/MgsR family transcriptional regulator
MYGIPNCDTVKKARDWMEVTETPYEFHDFKKEGVDRARLQEWEKVVGWEVLLNRRGTTFRKLEESRKSGLDAAKAIALMEEQPSMIKRPVVEWGGGVMVGFDQDEWRRVLIGG